MNAVLRVWWTFFTALPLQRVLAWIGAVWCGSFVLGGLVAGGDGLWVLGVVGLFVLVIFPSVFASAAVFRALSAPRANQLLPHFRARMLVGITLFMVAVLAPFALLLLNERTGGGPTPLEVIGYVLTVSTALFMWMFMMFGDWRWVWLWIVVPAVFGLIGLSSSSARELLSGIPAGAWPGAALLAWVAFVAWYVRARRIRPVMYVPQPPAGAWARTDLDGTVTRELALRTLVTGEPPRQGRRTLGYGIGTNIGLAVITLVLLTSFAGFASFTSFVWPFGTMLLLWGKATSIVHRSRLLWLRMPGSREAVRGEVERALLRTARGGVLVIVGIAAVYAASPLVDAHPQQLLAGFALATCAALFSTYLAFASIPGRALHLVSFGLMTALQLVLLLPPSPSLAAIGIVIAAELGGAILFRVLAVARWRHVDWVRLRPLPASNMFRGT